MGRITKRIKTSQKDLRRILKNKRGVIRVGATERDPNMRANEYENEGYSGKMRFAPTTNIRLAENKLLNPAKKCGTAIHNKHERSNLRDVDGFVYIIQGKRYKK